MIRTSYHTHNRFCDGNGEIAEYAEAAVAAGLKALGVTSHSPLNFPDKAAMRAADLPAYCAEVARLRDAYRGRLRVHPSLEFDFIPERHADLWALVASCSFDDLV
ncbi:MAG: PHP domain-containing protein [Armatimonadota bacterium]